MSEKVLIVDDDISVVKSITTVLQSNNYKVIAAFDAIAAVSKAIKEKPDLIILDMKIPAGSGMDVFEKLKRSSLTVMIPVIVLTASASNVMRSKMIEMGVKGFMFKPFKADMLLDKIDKILGKTSEVF